MVHALDHVNEYYIVRQEKLLQGLMAEILQMTSQAQPLKVGVPLYPFSLAGVFPNNQGEDGKSSEMDGVAAGGHVAPLPSPGYEAEDASMNGNGHGVSGIWDGGMASAASTSTSYHGGY
jgi:hypothetical protein